MTKKKKEPIEPEVLASEGGAKPEGESLEAEIASLRAQLAEKDELEKRLLRLQADMDNLRKRTAREKEEWWQLATADVLKELIPILDNFERAVGVVSGGESSDWAQGMIMVVRQFQATLARLGLEEVCNAGTFDPQCQEAIMQDNDSVEPENTVTAVFEKGYSHKGRLLRPSKVRVSTGGRN